MTQPAGVSVLVAAFNGAEYLSEQLRSILAQMSDEDEVIIVDDCSSDATPDILADYSARYPSVKVISNAVNAGVKATFETLLRQCSRDIVVLSDQDDVWTSGRKVAMVEALRHGGTVAVLANALIVTDRGVTGPFFPERPAVDSLWRNFMKNNFIGCCMAFRREVLDVALPFPPSISMHDWWIGTCAIAMGEVRYLAAPSLMYRRHSSNQSPSTRRQWRVILKDRTGNLLALATLMRRMVRYRRAAG